MSEDRPETKNGAASREVQTVATWLTRASWFALGVTVGIAGTVITPTFERFVNNFLSVFGAGG